MDTTPRWNRNRDLGHEFYKNKDYYQALQHYIYYVNQKPYMYHDFGSYEDFRYKYSLDSDDKKKRYFVPIYYIIAEMYRDGLGVQKDIKTAVKYFNDACQVGYNA